MSRTAPKSKVAATPVMDRDELTARLTELMAAGDLAVRPEIVGKLITLVEMLVQWSARINLTAIRDPHEILTLHIMDSAVVAPLIQGPKVADLGTGAGFPGLVLALLHPEISFTLIDSVAKKVAFVQSAAAALGLTNVRVIKARCETVVPADGGFDEIVCRAFAPLGDIVGLGLPLLAAGGHFVCMKSGLSQEELKAVPKSVRITHVVNLTVPGLDAERNAVFVSRS